MMKRCTQSSCRVTFNARQTMGVCPGCGKQYRVSMNDMWWNINGRRYNAAPVLQWKGQGRPVMMVKTLRGIVPGMSLREAVEMLNRKVPGWR